MLTSDFVHFMLLNNVTKSLNQVGKLSFKNSYTASITVKLKVLGKNY